jgi:hypothetical protein
MGRVKRKYQTLAEKLSKFGWYTIYKAFHKRGTRESFISDVCLSVETLDHFWAKYGYILRGRYGIRRLDILMLLSFMRKYDTLASTAAEWNTTTSSLKERLAQTKAALCQVLKEIDWRSRPGAVSDDPNQLFNNATFVLDTTSCPIQRSDNPILEDLTFSGYSLQHSLKYQIAISPYNFKILHVFGPVPGTFNDIQLLRMSSLMETADGERGIADKLYAGFPCEEMIIPLKKRRGGLNLRERVFNNVASAARVDVERIFRLIKRFRLLRERSRVTNLQDHGSYFFIACNFVNLEADINPLRTAPASVLLDASLDRVRQLPLKPVYSTGASRKEFKQNIRSEHLKRNNGIHLN